MCMRVYVYAEYISETHCFGATTRTFCASHNFTSPHPLHLHQCLSPVIRLSRSTVKLSSFGSGLLPFTDRQCPLMVAFFSRIGTSHSKGMGQKMLAGGVSSRQRPSPFQ